MRAFGKAFAQTHGCSGADVLSCMRSLKLADVMDAYTKWFCPKGQSSASHSLRPVAARCTNHVRIPKRLDTVLPARSRRLQASSGRMTCGVASRTRPNPTGPRMCGRRSSRPSLRLPGTYVTLFAAIPALV
jgi:hypothetical protein